MRTYLMIGTVAAALGAAAFSALADDSEAMLAAGGLVLKQNADIRMAAEDLTISPNAIHVRYEFTNDSGHDIDTTVAFPLPKLDMYEYSETPIGEHSEDPVNFVNFKVTENGHPIATQLQARAWHGTRDVSAQVRASGLPIGIYTDSFLKALDGLTADKLNALVKAGLMEVEGDSRRPKWTVELMYYWTEHFPAGKTVVIEHTYKPVSGVQFFGDFSLTDGEQRRSWVKDYCMDPGTMAAAKAQLAAFTKAHNPNEGALLEAYTTGFVIRTGNNWKGPIGRFHLTVDKLLPTNTLSMCWDAAPLTKTSPTRFESTVTNFAPKRDINFVVVAPPPSQ